MELVPREFVVLDELTEFISKTLLSDLTEIISLGYPTNSCSSQGQPRYVCESGEYVSREEDFISSALNPLYQEIFKNKTKFSGVREFGLDNSLLLEKLLDGVLFRPFSVMVETTKIFVYGLGVSNKTCNNVQRFAKSISDAIDANKKGLEGKCRILSIVADNFTLEELRKSN
ncbi:1468_t:CDS:2, partial [Entrophospora sp. SA101]